jgi:hypothetical protein
MRVHNVCICFVFSQVNFFFIIALYLTRLAIYFDKSHQWLFCLVDINVINLDLVILVLCKP